MQFPLAEEPVLPDLRSSSRGFLGRVRAVLQGKPSVTLSSSRVEVLGFNGVGGAALGMGVSASCLLVLLIPAST